MQCLRCLRVEPRHDFDLVIGRIVSETTFVSTRIIQTSPASPACDPVRYQDRRPERSKYLNERRADLEPAFGRTAASRIARTSASVLRPCSAACIRNARCVASERFLMVIAAIDVTLQPLPAMRAYALSDIKGPSVEPARNLEAWSLDAYNAGFRQEPDMSQAKAEALIQPLLRRLQRRRRSRPCSPASPRMSATT